VDHIAAIWDHADGPVAEENTWEQCIALYPGSSPGWASTPLPLCGPRRSCKPRGTTLFGPARAAFRCHWRRPFGNASRKAQDCI